VGETVGLKKPTQKKPDVAVPKPIVPPKKEAPKSWFGSLFQSKEPDPPKSAKDFLKSPRPELP
jgi:hypothetical protein